MFVDQQYYKFSICTPLLSFSTIISQVKTVWLNFLPLLYQSQSNPHRDPSWFSKLELPAHELWMRLWCWQRPLPWQFRWPTQIWSVIVVPPLENIPLIYCISIKALIPRCCCCINAASMHCAHWHSTAKHAATQLRLLPLRRAADQYYACLQMFLCSSGLVAK